MPNVFNRVLGGSGSGESADFLISGLSHSVLPSGYTEYDSITATGSQWINTNIPYFADFEIKGYVPNGASNVTICLNSSSGEYRLERDSASNPIWELSWNGSYTRSTKAVADMHTITYKNNIFSIDGTTIGSRTNTFPSGTMYLFCNESGSTAYPFLCNYFKAWDNNGNLIRYMIPCKNSNQEVGMLDIHDINNPRFYGNSGSGTFTVGNEVKTSTVTATKGTKTRQGSWQTIQVPNPAYHNLPSGFTEVEYIQSSGTQYISLNKYLPTDFDAMLLDCSFESLAQGYNLHGNCSNGVNPPICSIGATSNGTYYYGYYAVEGNIASSPTYSAGRRLKWYVGSDKAEVTDLSGNVIVTKSLSGTMQTRSHSQELFRWRETSSTYNYSRMWSGQLIKNGEVVTNLIPCHNDNTNKYGLLDISNPDNPQFYGDANGGDFTAGAIVPATLSASGYYVPNIDEYGTWTVTATDGTKTATYDVLVDFLMTYQFEMSYRFYLYNEGDECSSVTGGWTNSGYTYYGYATNQGTITKNADNITITKGYSIPAIGTTNLIDLTNYSTVNIECTWSGSGTGTTLSVSSSKAVTSSTELALYSHCYSGTYSADISNLTSGYILSALNWGDGTHIISKIWLE